MCHHSWRSLRQVCVLTLVLAQASAALAADPGTVWCWGNNDFNQLGDGTLLQNYVPVQVSGLQDAVAVAGGQRHCLALKPGGGVWAWGCNSDGQLGDGTTGDYSTPVHVPGLSDVVAVAGGRTHSLAVKSDGTVWAWGQNVDGQLGDGTTTDSLIPVQVLGPGGIGHLEDVVAVAAAREHSLALTSHGIVWAWGRNTDGQLGDGGASGSHSLTPVQVTGLAGVVCIACGDRHSLALMSDGTVRGWGANNSGQVGDGSTSDRSTPVQVSNLTGAVSIACGLWHSLAVKSDGTVRAWGYNNEGQLGDGTTVQSATPVPVSGLADALAAAGGEAHSVVLKSDRTVWAWGDNFWGQLGDGTYTDRPTPVQVLAGGSGGTYLTNVARLSAGAWHVAALVGPEPGGLYGWGDNDDGQIGDTTTVDRSVPTQADLSAAVAVDGGNRHTVTLAGDGTPWSAGSNVYGQLGDGTTTQRVSYTAVVGPGGVGLLEGIVATRCGWAHTVALHASGAILAWGLNDKGQLGNGSTTDSPTPVEALVPRGSGLQAAFVAVAAGQSHSAALRGDGTVWTWGDNSCGQLGDGSTNNSATPLQVPGINNAVAVDCGWFHTVVLREDGTVWCWGDNANGQLGDDSTTSRSTPAQVPYLSNVTAIACGRYFTAALDSDGTVWAWGDNQYGQLGNSSTSDSLTPEQVYSPSGTCGVLGSVKAIAAGGYHMAALQTTGMVFAWGRNDFGQLGDRTTTERHVPVPVLGGLTDVVAIGCGSLTTHAVVGPAPFCTLAVSADPPEGGLVGWAPQKAFYGYGEWVGLAAAAEAGYTFTGWDGDIAGVIDPNAAETLVCVTGVASLSARFAQPGTLLGWGYNGTGQLGDGTTTDRHRPVRTSNLTGAVAVAGGFWHSLALTADGSVSAWGRNDHGQLGDGTTTERHTPFQVTDLSNIVAVTGGDYHSLALAADGTAWAWGDNFYGQLGDGTTSARLTPVHVTDLSDLVAVAAGGYHSLALKADGTVWAWGWNTWGQLGDGTTTSRSTPVQVTDLSDVIAVAAGYHHSLALKLDGTVWTWGVNPHGQLGDGTQTSRSTPVQVLGPGGTGFLTDIVAVASNSAHSLAVTSDGMAWAWGNNSSGQLGDGTTTDRWTPVQVSGLSGVVAVAGGYGQSLALTADGRAWAWGEGSVGQLGDGTATDHPTPVRFSADGAVGRIAAGWAHGLAVVNPLPTYTLTAAADPPEGGTAEPPMVSDCYYGEPIPLMAAANPGFVFTGWTGDVGSVIGPDSACTVCFMTCDFSVTAEFAPGPLEIAAELDHPWVYQNTATTTQDRHKSRLTVSIVSGGIAGETYAVTVGEGGGALVNFTTAATADPLVVDVIGGRPGGSTPSAPASYMLSVAVEGDTYGQTRAAEVALKLCLIGDITGDGNINAVDKAHMNAWLNGMPLPGDTVRHVDLNGDGDVTAVDKVQVNRQLNGLGIL